MWYRIPLQVIERPTVEISITPAANKQVPGAAQQSKRAAEFRATGDASTVLLQAACRQRARSPAIPYNAELTINGANQSV